MATSKSANTYNRQNWENAEFPILCQTCLGDNPYVRMTRETYGRECKICARPFTVFRWCPGARMRFKKTEVCQTCSKLKNVCQTCLLDLDYGLPVQVRDHALGMKDDVPKSDVNKEFYTQNVEKELANSDGTTPGGTLGKANAPSDLLLKLARTTPYYKRNRPHICSFWVKGECKRGDECPYRHDMPTDPNDPLADQNIKDRYYGMSDPVAARLLKQASTMPTLEPPSDKSITTLYVGGLEGKVEESDLRDYFYQFGELRSISMVPRQNCAFVCFTSRAAAETAAERSFGKLILKGRRMKIMWGKSQGQQPAPGKLGGTSLAPVPGLPGALPLPPTEEKSQTNFFNLAPPSNAASSGPPPIPLTLPPPPGQVPGMPPPPMGHPLPPPPGGFPPPPPFGHPPFRPPPMPFYGTPPPPRMLPPSRLAMPRPPPGPPPIHYPSQDPHRLGAGKGGEGGPHPPAPAAASS